MLKHDSIWPHGLNTRLHMDSLVELAEFRRSCLRHGWPPDHDAAATPVQLDLDAVRRQCRPRRGSHAGPAGPRRCETAAGSVDHDAAATPAQLDLDAVRRQLAVSTDLPPPATTNDQRVPADNNKNTADTRDHHTSP